ncbi:MAG: DUF2891 domain-containing protein [Caulobacterales bacterium]
MSPPALTRSLASRFAGIALGHVTREYPQKLDHVLTGPGDLRGPRELHPSFFGSFDWHSAVHAHWLLARLLRRFADLAEASAIRARLDDAFAPGNVAGELAYLERPASAGFERPYGWAWLLMLQAELARHTDGDGRRWTTDLAPLAHAFADRFRAWLPRATYPIRTGAHSNSAFALLLALDYARTCSDAALDHMASAQARLWYGADADCQAWEPGGEDFLSPALTEAQLMCTVLDAEASRAWLGAFLPRLALGEPQALFRPATVSDRSDGKIAHLDGLNLSRARSWRAIAAALGGEARDRALAAARVHTEASLPHVAGDYMGEHWLATYALLALDGCD